MYEGIAEYLLPWLEGGWAPPFRVHIFPTDRCNLRCPSCWRWAINPEGKIPWLGQELSDARLLSLIDEVADFGVKEIELSGGGEPLLKGEVVFEMMRRIKNVGLRGAMTTNGTLFSPELLKMLVEIGWDDLIISLDGPNKQINDFLRPPGSFEKIIQTLKWLRDYKKEMRKEKPRITIQCVLSKTNAYAVVDMFKIGIKYNVDNIVFDPLKVFSAKGKPLALSSREGHSLVIKQLDRVRELVNSHSIGTNFLDFNKYPELVKESGQLTNFLKTFQRKNKQVNAGERLLSTCCYEPWYRLHISSLGDTAPCCLSDFSNKDNVKNKSLKEIWLGDRLSQFRQKILTNQLPPSCINCNASLFIHSRSIQRQLKRAWQEEKESGRVRVSKSALVRNKIEPPEKISLSEPAKADKWGRVNDIHDMHLLIEMGDKCNNKCIMCKHSWSENIHGDLPTSFMDPGLFIKIINELKNSRLKPISIDPLWAGESLMNPRFKEMISYMFIAIRRFGICKGTVINTNAFFLDKETTEIFLQHGRFVQEHADEGYYFRLYFSLDAATPETYSKIRRVPPAAMERTIANIDYFIRRRKELGLIIPNTIFIFIIMGENKHEALKFMQYWKKYLEGVGCRFEILSTWPLDTTKDAIYFRQLICPDVNKAIDLHRKVCTRLGLLPKQKKKTEPRKSKVAAVAEMKPKRGPCAALWRTPNIQASGIVTPCCRDIDLILNLGNINDYTIDEIWFGEKIQDLRRAHIKGDLTQYPTCASCVEPEGEVQQDEVDLLEI